MLGLGLLVCTVCVCVRGRGRVGIGIGILVGGGLGMACVGSAVWDGGYGIGVRFDYLSELRWVAK